MTVATNSHIQIDEKGVARIDGTRMKVIHLVKAKIAYSLSTEQLREAFADLSWAQIHAALSYYYDHQQHMDEQIKADAEEFERARQDASATPLSEKIRNMGLRP